MPGVEVLQVNTVGFYQLSKICITPAALVLEATANRSWPSKQEIAAIFALCLGVAQATISDEQVTTNTVGLATAAAAVCLTVLYQVHRNSLLMRQNLSLDRARCAHQKACRSEMSRLKQSCVSARLVSSYPKLSESS